MKKRNIVLSTILAASLLTVAGAGIASADSHRHCGFGHHGHHAGAMFGGGGMHRGAMPHMFKRLNLTDAQRDQVFKIMYAAMPAKHDKMKQLRDGRRALHDAAMASNYDAAKVRALADAEAKTIADLMVLRTETFHKVLGVLTPAQREQLGKARGHRHGRFEG
jgi:protein CpxP